jgi:hypothetical protein
MAVFVLLAGGFLPWFFTLSRISFEVISYVSVMAWVVYCQFIAFHDPSTKNRELPATLCGAFLGLAVYAYAAGRVTSFLYLAVLLAIAAGRHLWRPLAMLLAAFTAASSATADRNSPVVGASSSEGSHILIRCAIFTP